MYTFFFFFIHFVHIVKTVRSKYVELLVAIELNGFKTIYTAKTSKNKLPARFWPTHARYIITFKVYILLFGNDT